MCVKKKVPIMVKCLRICDGFCIELGQLKVYMESFRQRNSTSMDSRVSRDQLEILLDNLSRHPGLAKGYGLGGRSKETSERLWNELANKLNAVGNGATKTGPQWKRYWIDLKHKARTKASTLRREHNATGGGPSQHKPLSDVFQKVLSIIGEESACGDIQYRVPAFDTDETSPLGVRRQLFPPRSETTTTQTQAVSPNVSRAVAEMNSPSTHGHTMIVLESADENADRPPETYHSPSNVPALADTPVPQPRPQPRGSPSRNVRRAANRRSTTADNSWVVDLERRRIAAEEKISEAAMVMAEAAKINAQAAMIQAEAAQTQARALLNLAELLKK